MRRNPRQSRLWSVATCALASLLVSWTSAAFAQSMDGDDSMGGQMGGQSMAPPTDDQPDRVAPVARIDIRLPAKPSASEAAETTDNDKPNTQADTPQKTAPLTDREIAFHVLNRLAFGPKPGDVDKLIEEGWQNWFRRQLQPQQIDAREHYRMLQAEYPTLAMTLGDTYRMYRPENADDERRNELRRQLRSQITSSVLIRALDSPRQFEEVMAEFWRNHFNVDINKDEVLYLAANYEQQVIRKYMFGRFEDMLLASAQHPAMLVYLDNAVSQKPLDPAYEKLKQKYESGAIRPRSAEALLRHRGLNENYARELMELHTLGVKSEGKVYYQSDVIDVARLLTGWSVGWIEPRTPSEPREFGFVFRRHVHDFQSKQIFGRRFSGGLDEGEGFIRALANHPATAAFISEKLCAYLVNDRPSPYLVRKAAAAYRSSGGNLSSVYWTIATSDEFLERANYRAKFKTPFEFVVSSLRATDAKVEKPEHVLGALKRMGQAVYECEDPTGYYDESEAWLDPGVLVYRWDFALRLAPGKYEGVTVSPDLLKNLETLTPAQTRDRLVEELLPGGIDDQTAAVLDAVVDQAASQSSSPTTAAASKTQRQLLALVLGSPAFQQQ